MNIALFTKAEHWRGTFSTKKQSNGLYYTNFGRATNRANRAINRADRANTYGNRCRVGSRLESKKK